MTVSENLSLPRILCLHGGGVNGKVFRLQCRAIIASLGSKFRLVFMDAPYESTPHHDIVRVYGELGPFYRWLRFQPDHPELDAAEAAEDVLGVCLDAMKEDDGFGPWVGILGFSQGAKIAASILLAQQNTESAHGPGSWYTQFKFGILMAGSGPIVHLDSRLARPRHVADAAMQALEFEDWPQWPYGHHGEHVVNIPTLHVHGLQDPGLERHRRLMDLYCNPGETRLVQWNAGHRLPIKPGDVDMVVKEMLEMAMEAGVLTT